MVNYLLLSLFLLYSNLFTVSCLKMFSIALLYFKLLIVVKHQQRRDPFAALFG